MWKYKAEYENQILHIKGYGVINTKKISANTIAALSLALNLPKMIKFVEKIEVKKVVEVQTDAKEKTK